MTVRVKRVSHRPCPVCHYREVHDSHYPHANCSIAAVVPLIPSQYLSAWQKGINWYPKINGWEQTLDHALLSVRTGVRPLLYGWPKLIIQDLAAAHGFSYYDYGWIAAACQSQNADMAELLGWSHSRPEPIQHIINGILLGYPLAAVETWVLTGCPGPSLKETLQQ